MKLIHLVWVASSDTDNNGHLNLWLESPKALNKKEAYPYQVDQKMLDEFAQMFFKDHVFKQTKLTMHFPCNKDDEPIPSPLIANIADIENREVESLVPLMIHTLEIQNALSFVKDLNFASHTAPVEREAWRFLAAPRAARLNVIPRFKTYQIRLNLVRQSALSS
ncbi:MULTISPECIES: hypothetical protein [Cysteiniphilum]|uniref:hypothetical protein n=1 Tax=Cysteiniphilum TaxID=2056696 RepID=UPI0017844F41|nr:MULTISPECIES: hypothetical protein [Cysteiniphilum]